MPDIGLVTNEMARFLLPCGDRVVFRAKKSEKTKRLSWMISS